MNRSKKIITLILAIMVLACTGITAFAAENVNILNPYPPTCSAGQGRYKPGKHADTVNLANDSYDYKVTKIGARVFTNKFLTGVNEVNVSVDNWNIINYQKASEAHQLTISIYDKKADQVIGRQTIKIDDRGTGYVTFSGLETGVKYYISFEVPTNTNSYSFDGSIH